MIDGDEVSKLQKAIHEAIRKAFPPIGGVDYQTVFTVFTYHLVDLCVRANVPLQELLNFITDGYRVRKAQSHD